jgi:hypothetical protein
MAQQRAHDQAEESWNQELAALEAKLNRHLTELETNSIIETAQRHPRLVAEGVEAVYEASRQRPGEDARQARDRRMREALEYQAYERGERAGTNIVEHPGELPDDATPQQRREHRERVMQWKWAANSGEYEEVD